MRKLFPYIKPQLKPYVWSMLLKAGGTFTDLLIPLIMGVVIDQGIATGNTDMIVRLCLLMLAVAIASLTMNLSGHYLSAHSTQAMGDNMRRAIYRHIQGMTISSVDEITTASLITRNTNDVEHVIRTLLMVSRMMMRAPITAIGGTILVLFIDPWLTLVLLVGMVLLGTVSVAVYKVTRPIYARVQKSIDRMTAVLRENLDGIRVVKAFNKQSYELGRFDTQSGEVRRQEVKAGTYNAFMSPAIALISSITTAVVLYVSGFRVGSGALQIGSIVTVLNYINMILNAMRTIPRMFMMFSRANTSAERINRVLEDDSHTEYGAMTMPAPAQDGGRAPILEFCHVTFRYPGANVDALSDVSFAITRGSTLAVIGNTGAGKTTLLNLVLRLYEPTQGSIYFEGRDIREYDRQTLTRRITAAMQQYNIFAMSIRENILLDKPLDEARLSSAVESAQIKPLIDELEEGFDHRISQNGSNLSGGQKQRVSVARTLYRDSDLVVLDDVSSALDYATDLRLRRALKENYSNTSVILISQRIASVRGADQILVLHNGRLMGLGTHDELVKGCDTYRAICRTQNVEVPGEEAMAV